MPNFKVINPDTPEEIDLVQDIPLVDEESGSDQIDSDGNILVKRYITRSVNLEGITSVKEALPQIKENKKNLEELYNYSHSVNTDQQNQILENNSKITELLMDTTALEVTVTELENKIKSIQGIDIDEVKEDLDLLKQSAYLISGGALKGDVSIQTLDTATLTLTPSGSSSYASFSCNNDVLDCTTTWGKLFKQSEEGSFFYGLSSKALADKNGKELTNYISDILGANAQLTFIKGDGTSQVLSINNVVSATKATQDGNGNVITDTYIPHTGGTLSGKVCLDTNAGICGISNTNKVFISGNEENQEQSAYLTLNGTENADSDLGKGGFRLASANAEGYSYLDGKADGSLTWGTKNIVRSVNGVNADTQGNVNITAGEIDSFSYGIVGYIRYKNGLQLCWGSDIDSRSRYTSNTTITFLKPFYNTNYAIIGTGFFVNNHGEQLIRDVTTTGFKTASYTSWCATGGFLAIGRWK